jgi:hypothetical protein
MSDYIEEHKLYRLFGRGDHCLSQPYVNGRAIEKTIEDFKRRGWIRFEHDFFWLTSEGASAVAGWWANHAKELKGESKFVDMS